ncbi:MAG: hypothetical protein ACTSRE_00100 [Promethearchaeota archaeon]
MPPRGFGRILRGMRRGPRILRHILRPRRIVRRILFGSFIYLAIAGSRPYKLHPDEVERIETHSGKSTEDMTEEELKTSMSDLNIENREVSDEEYNRINEQNGKSTTDDKSGAYCKFCGAKLTGPGKFCANCGSKA